MTEDLVETPVEDPIAAPRAKKPATVWSYPDPGERRPWREPLTEEEWERVLRGKPRTVVFLVSRERREWAGDQARSCGNCANVSLAGDPRRGWCAAQKMMTGITFPVLCRAHA